MACCACARQFRRCTSLEARGAGSPPRGGLRAPAGLPELASLAVRPRGAGGVPPGGIEIALQRAMAGGSAIAELNAGEDAPEGVVPRGLTRGREEVALIGERGRPPVHVRRGPPGDQAREGDRAIEAPPPPPPPRSSVRSGAGRQVDRVRLDRRARLDRLDGDVRGLAGRRRGPRRLAGGAVAVAVMVALAGRRLGEAALFLCVFHKPKPARNRGEAVYIKRGSGPRHRRRQGRRRMREPLTCRPRRETRSK